MRPQSGYYPDVIAEAAALWESLSQNHPFIDGNKRTAIASMAAHLFMNGIWLEAEQLETQDGFGGPNWKRGCGHTLSPGCDHRESRATSDHMPFTNFWS